MYPRCSDGNLAFANNVSSSSHAIQQDLEQALRKFESGGLSGIIELEGSIEAARKTHQLMATAGLGVSRVLPVPRLSAFCQRWDGMGWDS